MLGSSKSYIAALYLLQALKKAQWKQFPFSPLPECPFLRVARPAKWAGTSSPYHICVQTDKLLISFLYQKFWMHIVVPSFFYLPPDLSVFGSCFPFETFQCASVKNGLSAHGVVWSLVGFYCVKEILPHGFFSCDVFLCLTYLTGSSQRSFFKREGSSGPFHIPNNTCPSPHGNRSSFALACSGQEI